jgi:hypothetical protein
MNHRDKRRKSRSPQVDALEQRALLSGTTVSATTATNEVYSLYETLLQRNPSQADVGFWTGVLEEGVKPSVVFNGFVNSTEYQGLVSSGSTSSASTPTFASFQAAAATVNNIPVVSGSSLGGTANVTTYVNNLYLTLLGRSFDTAGQTFWVDKINNGASLNSVVAGFLSSSEYQGLVSNGTGGFVLASGTTGSTTEATTFVDSLYTSILQRSADTPGESFWVGRIQVGESPSTIITAFLTSSEYLQAITSGTIIA